MSDFVDLPEAVRLLGTSRPTLYRWLREERLHGYRVGRQWRFSREELERFVRGVDADPLARDLAAAIAFFRERAERRSATDAEPARKEPSLGDTGSGAPVPARRARRPARQRRGR